MMIRRSLLPLVLVCSSPLATASLVAQSSVVLPGTPVDSFTPSVAAPSSRPAAASAAAPAPAASTGLNAEVAFGISGALRAAVLRNSQPVAPALLTVAGTEAAASQWVPVLGTVRRGLLGEPAARTQVVAPDGAGVWRLVVNRDGARSGSGDSLLYVTTVPFAEKRDGHLNGYHIGNYPTELSPRSDVYAPPEAFIEVTPENQDLQISEHFRLRHFLTKDQFDVWPKYLALNLRLVDKLELVIQELNAMGVRALAIHVMSGFRTPQYNGPGGDGRATLSRHMYGDAADVWVDGDHDGYIDDLNGDGRNDIRDAEVLLRAVERVEQKYPELTGGAGLYQANHTHGPYVHVDVRGTRARW